MKYHVDVTQEDIDEATRRVHVDHLEKSSNCPVSLAVARTLGQESMGTAFGLLGRCRGTRGSIVPLGDVSVTAAFQRRFDAKFPVAPFSFDFEMPDDWDKEHDDRPQD